MAPISAPFYSTIQHYQENINHSADRGPVCEEAAQALQEKSTESVCGAASRQACRADLSDRRIPLSVHANRIFSAPTRSSPYGDTFGDVPPDHSQESSSPFSDFWSFNWWDDSSNGQRALGLGIAAVAALPTAAVFLGAALTSVFGVGCGCYPSTSDASRDASLDARRDSSPDAIRRDVRQDAPRDVRTDAPRDAWRDAGVDGTRLDSSSDALRVDAARDIAPTDTRPDTPIDGTRVDALRDVRINSISDVRADTPSRG